jgi:Glucose inhibited division protein A
LRTELPRCRASPQASLSFGALQEQCPWYRTIADCTASNLSRWCPPLGRQGHFPKGENALRSAAMAEEFSPLAPIHVIGGGLAGSEAAWQIARAGISVMLHEVRPKRQTPGALKRGSDLAMLRVLRTGHPVIEGPGLHETDPRQNRNVGYKYRPERRARQDLLSFGQTGRARPVHRVDQAPCRAAKLNDPRIEAENGSR